MRVVLEIVFFEELVVGAKEKRFSNGHPGHRLVIVEPFVTNRQLQRGGTWKSRA
jgi:hypothetical protein